MVGQCEDQRLVYFGKGQSPLVCFAGGPETDGRINMSEFMEEMAREVVVLFTEASKSSATK